MPKPNRHRSKKVAVLGESRTPGVIGINWEPLFDEHDVFERSDHKLDLDSPDWINAKQIDGDPTSVFYRGKKLTIKKPDAPLQIDFTIREDDMNDARGVTHSRLFLEFGIVDMNKGKFAPVLLSAGMQSNIRVLQRHQFDSLSDFKPHYDEFTQLIADHGSRSAAFRVFATKHVLHSNNDYSTDFWGKRVKTVEHEVQHLRYAQEHAQVLVENLMGVLKTMGHTKRSRPAWPEVRRIIEQMAGDWNSDPKGAFHRRIAEHDCLVMIAIYEAFALSREEAKAAGNADPKGGLMMMLDQITIDMMEGIGEPLDSWGK